MRARDGMQFLLSFPREERQKAIDLAGGYAPSSAFRQAGMFYVLAHPDRGGHWELAFAKGARWLAVLRRDEGEEAFREASQEILK